MFRSLENEQLHDIPACVGDGTELVVDGIAALLPRIPELRA